MKHIKDFQKYNEGWKEMALAGALTTTPLQDVTAKPQSPKEISSISSRMKKDDINIIIGYLMEASIELSVPKSIIKKLIDIRNGKSVDLSEEESETIRGVMDKVMDKVDYQQKKAKKDTNIKHLIEGWKSLGEITDYRLEGDEVILTKSLKFPPRKKGNEPLF